ncbi:hypothetical protein OG806_23035 [Streptomyces sp. NBC_00882]|uniref:hypothetical protein n=1 Tax=Streptomyces TaxID=1883 RepID=UPI00386C8E9A|nr:hypothetical protein OG806_23035 [Streptomyces sp. NBC_00882]WSZ59132.1 hypothetical protein OH824_22405 [Streptomyces canus]
MSTPTLHRRGLTRTVLRLHRTALVVGGVFVLACVGAWSGCYGAPCPPSRSPW